MLNLKLLLLGEGKFRLVYNRDFVIYMLLLFVLVVMMVRE